MYVFKKILMGRKHPLPKRQYFVTRVIQYRFFGIVLFESEDFGLGTRHGG